MSKFQVSANIAPTLKQPAKSVIDATSPIAAARAYVAAKIVGYDLIPGGRKESPHLHRYEIINYDAQLGGVVWVREMHSNPARKPAAKKPAAKRAYVNRPSQATKKPPTKRLKARRAANVRGSGMFPNPSKPKWAFDAGDADKNIFSVHARLGKGYSKIAEFKDYKKAVEYAEAYANAHEKQMKVTGNLGKAGSRVKSGTINRSW